MSSGTCSRGAEEQGKRGSGREVYQSDFGGLSTVCRLVEAAGLKPREFKHSVLESAAKCARPMAAQPPLQEAWCTWKPGVWAEDSGLKKQERSHQTFLSPRRERETQGPPGRPLWCHSPPPAFQPASQDMDARGSGLPSPVQGCRVVRPVPPACTMEVRPDLGFQEETGTANLHHVGLIKNLPRG